MQGIDANHLVVDMMQSLAPMVTTSCWQHDPDRRAIVASASVIVDATPSERDVELVTRVAYFQAFEARVRLSILAQIADCEPAVAARNGWPRTTPSPRLAALEREIAQARDIAPDLEPAFFAVPVPDAVWTIERHDTGLTAQIDGAVPTVSAFSELFLATTQPHPGFGRGLLSVLALPYVFDEADVPGIVGFLNLMQHRGDAPTSALGAWCVHPANPATVAHASFWPTAICDDDLPRRLLADAPDQVLWVRAVLEAAERQA